jgi:D-lactate dehydrogenase
VQTPHSERRDFPRQRVAETTHGPFGRVIRRIAGNRHAATDRRHLKDATALMPVYDLAEFLLDFVTPRVNIAKKPGHVAVHIPCSLRKSGQEAPILELAKLCMERVSVPSSAPCCGFAGDRGFTHPELTASALVSLKTEIPADCQVGYSTSRTCEIGVSLHSGISYQSIAYLVDEVVKKAEA